MNPQDWKMCNIFCLDFILKIKYLRFYLFGFVFLEKGTLEGSTRNTFNTNSNTTAISIRKTKND